VLLAKASSDDITEVPFGIKFNAVFPFVVLLWIETLSAEVALLKSPRIRLPVLVKVRLPDVVKEAALPVVTMVPEVVGKVRVVVPDTAGAERVTEPLESPLITKFAMFLP